MTRTDKRRSPVRLAFVLALLALSALLAACAAPAGVQPPAAQVPAATQAAPTEAPAAAAPTEAAPEPTAAPVEPTTAPAEPTAAPAPTEAPAATEPPAASGVAVSFSNDIMPVFEQTCIKCHGGEDGTKGDLDLRTYDAMMKGGKDGLVVAPGDHANSMLWKLVDNGKMPRRQPKLPQEQIDLIARWIDEGAQNN